MVQAARDATIRRMPLTTLSKPWPVSGYREIHAGAAHVKILCQCYVCLRCDGCVSCGAGWHRDSPLRNWDRRIELASRVAALIHSETGADPFAAFGWKVLNDIVNGLVTTGESPNLAHLKRYIEGGTDNLLLNTVSSSGNR